MALPVLTPGASLGSYGPPVPAAGYAPIQLTPQDQANMTQVSYQAPTNLATTQPPQTALPPQNLFNALPANAALNNANAAGTALPFTQPGVSLEQQALNGGGPANKQQISNLLGNLGQLGSATNNQLQNAPVINNQMPVQNLINPNVAYQNNSSQPLMNGSQANYQAPPQAAPPQGLTPGVSLGSTQQAPAQTPIQLSNQDLNKVQDVNSGQPAAANLVSDQNLKTNITTGKQDISSFLNSINAHSYQYKNPEVDGQGVFTSPMAQELEQTELGKQAVIDTPRGKMVNYPRLGAVNLAAVSVVHKETQRLQAQIDQLRKQMKLKDK